MGLEWKIVARFVDKLLGNRGGYLLFGLGRNYSEFELDICWNALGTHTINSWDCSWIRLVRFGGALLGIGD